MTNEVINYLAQSIADTGLFNENYGYALLKRDADGDKPITFKGNSQVNIEYDPVGSFSYIRINGDIAKTTNNRPQTTSSVQDVLNIYIPVRIVCFKKKDDFDDCAGFESYTLLEKLTSGLTLNGAANEINAISVDLKPKSEIHDTEKLLKQEYSGREMPDMLFEWAYCAADYSIEIEINKSCINKCSTNGY